jgi:ketopantoate reductase
MRILLVGAGAVGQVYGYHLQRGGAEVSFFVRERYVAELERGLTLYPLNVSRQPEPLEMQGFGLRTQAGEVAAERFEQLWLCVSSSALRAGGIAELLAASGDATVVLLQPGLEDRDWALGHVPEARLVTGTITMLSYFAPLEGESRPRPGVAYWLPPLTPSPFSGPPERVQPVVDTLRRGGYPARTHPDARGFGAVSSAVMMPHLLALEAAGWSLSGLRRSALLPLASAAARESMAVVAAYRGEPVPLARMAVRPWAFSALLALAPRAVPFDLEAYLRVHFTKTGEQTREMVRTYREIGRRKGLQTPALDELEQRHAAAADASHP